MEQLVLLACPLQRGCSQHPASNCPWLFYTNLSCAHSLHFTELSLCLPLHSRCVKWATILSLALRVVRFKKLSTSCLVLLNSQGVSSLLIPSLHLLCPPKRLISSTQPRQEVVLEIRPHVAPQDLSRSLALPKRSWQKTAAKQKIKKAFWNVSSLGKWSMKL